MAGRLGAAIGDGSAVDEGAASAALDELEGVPMTLALLQATGAGKVANKLKKSQTALAVRARALVDKWKALAAGA
jgi:hypothetical protein